MSEWINADICKPPESHSVILCIMITGDQHISDCEMHIGFYGDKDWDKTGFYVENIDGDEYIGENENLKVICWTLLPRRPHPDIFDGTIKNIWMWSNYE